MYKEDKEKYVILNIGEETKNIRIDKYLSNLKELNISREKIKKGILSESILLNLKKTKNSSILKKDDTIYIEKELLKTDDEIRKENQDKKHEILKDSIPENEFYELIPKIRKSLFVVFLLNICGDLVYWFLLIQANAFSI